MSVSLVEGTTKIVPGIHSSFHAFAVFMHHQYMANAFRRHKATAPIFNRVDRSGVYIQPRSLGWPLELDSGLLCSFDIVSSTSSKQCPTSSTTRPNRAEEDFSAPESERGKQQKRGMRRYNNAATSVPSPLFQPLDAFQRELQPTLYVLTATAPTHHFTPAEPPVSSTTKKRLYTGRAPETF